MRYPSRGFTLLEVMVSIAILAFISLFTVQAIQRALSTRGKIQRDVDRTSTLRDALRVMERDINLAFNYRDISITIYNKAQEARKKAATASPGTATATAQYAPEGSFMSNPQATASPLDAEKYKPKVDKIVTQFLGTKDTLDFTSVSNVRMTEDQNISSQAEIGYFTKSCRRRSTQEQSSKCLWRRVSNYIHEDDITKHGDETVLLENVTDFKLRYLGPGHEEDWLDTWVTDQRGDDSTKGKFPYAVEVTIEINAPTDTGKDKKLRMTTVASVRNPNNPAPEDSGTAAAGAATGVNGTAGATPGAATANGGQAIFNPQGGTK